MAGFDRDGTMPIRIPCVHCGRRLRLDQQLAGKKVRCPHPDCRGVFVVPHPEPAEATPVERPPAVEIKHPVRPRSRPDRIAPLTSRRRPSRLRWFGLAGAALTTIVLGVLGLWSPWAADKADPSAAIAAAPTPFHEQPFDAVQPFFETYCIDCHTGGDAEGGFAIDGFSSRDQVVGDRKRWERVYRLLEVGNMPPSDAEQPPDEERAKVVGWLDHALYYVDCSQPVDPGRVTVRRLNRNEYNNTVRDLIGVDFRPGDKFPSDDVGYGFDNIGDVLTVPPLLVEKYLAAAEEITGHAILTADPDAFSDVFLAKEMRGEGSVYDGDDGSRVFPSRGTVSRKVKFPRAAEYLVTIDAAADQHGNELAKMALSLDGEVRQSLEVRGDRQREVYEVRIRVDPGNRRLGVTFTNDYYEEGKGDRNLYVYSVSVSGPLGLPAQLPESHQRLVAKRPSGETSVDQAARHNLQPLLRRAFRRSVEEQEVDPYVGFVTQAVERGDSFERGMQIAVQAVLVSPQFLFRIETPGEDEWTGQTAPLNDFELATRLSYFLWSSMPDDELLSLAEAGRLQEDAVLRQQADRMLQDPKADALITNFAGQWLALRKLGTNEVAPDQMLFPEYTPELQRDIWKETELFFGAIVREDRPITELISGRYSFLNQRLAELYGVSGPQGEEFERFDFADGRRQGVLTQASVLTLTSYPERTSPVKRGEWVLTNLLGDAPPEPPPVVPALDETQVAHPELSLREQLVLHRADPGCASCHKVMDEIGFGLENFDPIGRWREESDGRPIDASATLPTGESFNGPAELVQILAARKSDFARCFAEKLLTYALGRGLEFYDRCAVDEIVTQTEAADDRFSAVVHAIIRSEPFQRRRANPR